MRTGPSGKCQNVPGSFTCSCQTGYQGDGKTCTDVNECDSNPCHANAGCFNSIGGYDCTCKQGYYDPSGNGTLCTEKCDKKGCPTANGYCVDDDKTQTATCFCDASYTLNSTSNKCNAANQIAVQLTLNRNFTDSLNDRTSADFIALQDSITQPIRDAVASPDLLDVQVLSFAAGSVVADIGVQFSPDADTTSSALASQVIQGVASAAATIPGADSSSIAAQNINFCADTPCQNGGACTSGAQGPECACTAAFFGPPENNLCQDMRPCFNASNCPATSVCTDIRTAQNTLDFTCECPPGWVGVNGQSCTEKPIKIYAGTAGFDITSNTGRSRVVMQGAPKIDLVTGINFVQVKGDSVGSVMLVQETPVGLDGELGALFMKPAKHLKSSRIDYSWLAVGSPYSKQSASINFGVVEILFKSGEKCQSVDFNTTMDTSSPAVLLSLRTKHVKHADWLDNSVIKVTEVSNTGFRFCVHEAVFFSGHHVAYVNYLAVNANMSHDLITEVATVAAVEANTYQDDNRFCTTHRFEKRYTAAPEIYVTPQVRGNDHADVVASVDCVTQEEVTICLSPNGRSLQAYDWQNATLNIFVAGGNEHACSGFTPDRNMACAVNATSGAPMSACREECGANNVNNQMRCTDRMRGRQCSESDYGTYESVCEFEKSICKMYKDPTALDRSINAISGLERDLGKGNCSSVDTGDAWQAGSTALEGTEGYSVTGSVNISLTAANFHVHSPVLVMVTLDWAEDSISADGVHSAAVVWSTAVSSARDQFTVRALSPTGFMSPTTGSNVVPNVTWVAYQVNIHTRTNNKLFGGSQPVPQFAHGSFCNQLKHKDFQVSGNPVLSMHKQDGMNTEGVTTWLETTTTEKRACVHEISHFGGNHANWQVNFLKLGSDVTGEDIDFSNNYTPEEDGPICQNMTYGSMANDRRVFVSRTHQVSSLQDYSTLAYSAWIEGESANTQKRKVCYDYTDVNEAETGKFNVLQIRGDRSLSAEQSS